jgi:hypothetical protein
LSVRLPMQGRPPGTASGRLVAKHTSTSNGASFMAANGRGSKPSSVVASSDSSGHAPTRTWTCTFSPDRRFFEPLRFAAGPGRSGAPEAAGTDPSFALDMNRLRELLEKVPDDLGCVLALQGHHSPMQRQISVAILHLERSRPWFHQGLNALEVRLLLHGMHRKASPLLPGSWKLLLQVADVAVVEPRIGDRGVQRDPAVLVGFLER